MNTADAQTAANIRRWLADRQRNDDQLFAGRVARTGPADYAAAAREIEAARGDLPLCRFGPGGDFTTDYTPIAPSPIRLGIIRRIFGWIRWPLIARAEGRP